VYINFNTMAGENQLLDLSMLDNIVLNTARSTVTPPISEEQKQVETQVKTEDTVQLPPPIEKIEQVIEKPKLELDKGKAEDLVALLDDFDDKETSTEDPSGGEGDDKASNNDSPAKSVYEAAAALLIEQGALPELKDVSSIKTPEDFANAVRESLEELKYSGLTELQRTYLKAIETGVPHEVVQGPIDVLTRLESVTDHDIKEDPELREALIRADLSAQGWDEYRITKQIDRLKQSKEDVEEALLAKVTLHKNNKEFIENQRIEAENKKAAEEKENERQIIALKDAVYNESLALGSIKVDGVLKDRVYKMMTEVVDEVDGIPVNAVVKDRLSDPVDFEKRFYYAYTITNGFKNLGRLQRAAESNAAKGLKQAIESSGVLSTGSGAGVFGGGHSLDIPDIVKV
jgi:hypothetical protein